MDIDYTQGTVKGVPSLTPEQLKRIGAMCRQERKLAQAVKDAEEALKKADEAHRKLVEDILPGMLKEAGVKEIKLDDGWQVAVDSTIRANINEENRDKAHKWLRSNGFGSLIKNTISVTFGMGEDKKADVLYHQLAKKYNTTKQDERVHPSTLRSFVEEVLAGKVVVKKKPVSLPESISYVELPIAKIKEPKAYETRKHEKQDRNPL